MEEAAKIVLNLFRAMDDEEKTATILALGKEIEDTGLVSRLVPERASEGASPTPKRRGSSKPKRPWWARRVTGIDKSKKGVMQMEGEWLDSLDFSHLDNGQIVVVGIRWPEKKYFVCEVSSGMNDVLYAAPGLDLEVRGVAVNGSGDFKAAMKALESHFGITA